MTRYLRAELVLPVTIIAAAIMVGASEFMTTFEFNSGGEPQAVSLAADRHTYALLILAVFTVAGMLYAVRTGLRTAALGTAALGLASLLLFLILDLPDAGKAGPLGDDPTIYFADARADPVAGFWLEAVGTVVLGLATVAFATLNSAQLRAPAELLSSRRRARANSEDQGAKQVAAEVDAEADETQPERTRRRPWSWPKPAGDREPKKEREPVPEPKKERESRPEPRSKHDPRPEPRSKRDPRPEPRSKRDPSPGPESSREPERKPRPTSPQRPSREHARRRPRTASEERAAARARLARESGKAPAEASRKQPEPPRRLLPDLLRRLRGNGG